jgi:branched-chain amino acid aminotransferase
VTLPAWVWIDGEFRRGDEPTISPFDRGLTQADGLYETLLGLHGRPLFFDDHWTRLSRSAGELGIPLKTDPETLHDALEELIENNGLGDGRVRLKVVLTRGPSVAPPWEMACERPTLLATAWPAHAERTEPLAVTTLPWRRDPADGIWQHKTINLLSRGLARAELVRRGFDDGLALNTRGRVCEATTSNLFALIDGRIVTPPVIEGLLPGTVRGRLLHRAGRLAGLEVAEEPLKIPQLRKAEAVWLSSAISWVQPIGRFDQHELTRSPPADDILAQLRSLLGEEKD